MLTTIRFRCKNAEFKNIDTLLMEQEYTELPEFDNIIINTETDEYRYSIGTNNGLYYIITE